MIEMNLQFFGGNGSNSWGGGGGGSVNPVDTTSLLSASGKQSEIKEVMSAVKSVYDDYGIDLSDIQLATLKGKDANVMAYYDSDGNLAVNKSYFDSKKMDAAYDRCVQSGFHPDRGNKSGLEATAAHELGHRLTDTGRGIDATSKDIVQKAAKKLKYKNSANMAAKISGYAKTNYAECVAEAFADVYCNGKNAKKESRAVVSELNKYYGR